MPSISNARPCSLDFSYSLNVSYPVLMVWKAGCHTWEGLAVVSMLGLNFKSW